MYQEQLDPGLCRPAALVRHIGVQALLAVGERRLTTHQLRGLTRPHLWQLLTDPPEHMVVEVPRLVEVFDAVGTPVLLAPIMRISQVPPVSLQTGSSQNITVVTQHHMTVICHEHT